MSNLVTASNGVIIDLDNLVHTYTYVNGLVSTDIATVTSYNPITGVTTNGKSFMQTYNYVNNLLTSISLWVQQ